MLLLFWHAPQAATATVRAATSSGSALAARKGGTVPIALRAPARVAADGRRGALTLVQARGTSGSVVGARKSTPAVVGLRGAGAAQLSVRRGALGLVALRAAVRGVPTTSKGAQGGASLRGRGGTLSVVSLRASRALVQMRIRSRTDILYTAVTGLTLGSALLGSRSGSTTQALRATVATVLVGAGAAGATVPARVSRAALELGATGGSDGAATSAREARAALAASSGSDVDAAHGRRSRGRVSLAVASWTETALTVGHSGSAAIWTQSAGTLILHTSILSPSVPFDPHRPLDLGTVYRGDTIILPVWQARDRAGNIIDLSGSTVWFTAKVDLAVTDVTTPTIQCSTADGGVVILDAPTGLYRVTLVSSQTYALTDDTVFTFDVQVITPAPVTRTIKWGSLRVVRDVTRAVA